MPLPIGLQFFTVRDRLADDLAGTCQRVAEIGYTHAEVGPFAGHTTEDVSRAALDAGLTIVASHEMSLITDQAGETLRMLAALGIPYAVQPALPRDLRNADGYLRVAERLAGLDGGEVTVAYHNHGWEFEPAGGAAGDKLGYDLLVRDTTLAAELDTAWVAVAGHDPVAEMRRLSGRLPLIHVKDCRDFENKTLCELGDGKVPVADIVAAAEECGVTCLVVEQDNTWVDTDPLKSAERSFKYLQKVNR